MKKNMFLLLILFSTFLYGQNNLKGYEVLRMARENVPIGAEWVDGVGVNGEGVTQDNIEESNPSWLNLDSDKNFKQGLDFSILNYLGLGGNYRSNTVIKYHNLKIYTVKDFTKTNLRSGQNILYEAIKADSITFVLKDSVGGKLKAQLDEKFDNLKITANTKFDNEVTISGKNLFMAYRVFQLGKTKKKNKKVKIKDTRDGGGIRKVDIQDYELSFNDAALRKCTFPNRPMEYDELRYQECQESSPIEIIINNFANTGISGKPFNHKIKMPGNSGHSLFFSRREDNKLITDVFEITYIARPPTAFQFYMDNHSEVSLTSMVTPLKMYKNPSAPGW